MELGTKPRPSGGCSNTNGGSECECELAGAREPGGRREANANGEHKTAAAGAAVTATAAATMTMAAGAAVMATAAATMTTAAAAATTTTAAAAAVQYYSDGSGLPPLFYFIFYFT